MTQVKFLNLRKTSTWPAAIGVIVALAAIASHPMLKDAVVRLEIIRSLGDDIMEYLVFAIGAFLLFWAALHRFIGHRQISRCRWPRFAQVRRELMFSISSQIIMSAVALYLLTGSAAIMGNVDTGTALTDWLWGVCLCFILFAIEDTVFYWTHRAMHHPRLFAAFHRVHHESTDPTPFTAFSFHPLEAAVQGVNGLAILAVLMLLPWHPVALAVFGIGQIAFNVIGHLGYEVYPKTWNRIPLLRWKTPGFHHYQHHQNVGGNYALYFRWWDKICGTEFRDFEARYDRIFDASTSTSSRPHLHESSTTPDDSVASSQ